MIPKEKTEELITEFMDINNIMYTIVKRPVLINIAKRNALIAVNKIIEALEEHQWQNRHVIEDYKLVKQELENYE